ncbi:MAG TPA: GGDEF domain-containing protein [Burkholderiaceae bacterium]|nr:GGDEF domain-containing protein [Burkholderiaceae bacterium]
MFDIRTVCLVGALTAAIGAAAFLTLRRLYPHARPALTVYGGTMLVGAGGFAAVAFRGAVPDWIGFGVSNALLASAALLAWMATRMLYGLRPHAWAFATACTGNVAFWLTVSAGPEAAPLRIAAMALAQGVATLMSAWTVVQARALLAERGSQLLAGLFFAFGLLHGLRGFALLRDGAAIHPQGVLASEPLQVALALAFSLYPIALTLTVLLHLHARAAVDLKRRATTDELTGVALRRHFFDLAAERLAASRRRGSRSYLLMIDLDHFKRINDRHGHAIGDQVLRHVGQVLQRAVERDGVLGRYGGEEFCGLIDCRDDGHATRRIEEVRRAISGSPFLLGAHPMQLTASIGAAPVGEHETLVDALQRADQCVYQAKREGRDRIVKSVQPVPQPVV